MSDTSLPTSCTSGTVYSSTGTSLAKAAILGKTYFVRVCAIDGAGNMSSGSTKQLTFQ
jgi:hypothetical protein